MQDSLDIVKNIERVYDSTTAFTVLKDFERVLDELDIYVYKNWEDGELASGPKIDRHFVTCVFMWLKKDMPDPMGGKRLLDYDCKVRYKKDYVIIPRKIKKPDDIRPGTKKGKLDKTAVWLVEIKMPKKLIADIYGGYNQIEELQTDPATQANPEQEMAAQPADTLATGLDAGIDAGGIGGAPAAGGDAATGISVEGGI